MSHATTGQLGWGAPARRATLGSHRALGPYILRAIVGFLAGLTAQIDGYAGQSGPWFLDVHVVDPTP